MEEAARLGLTAADFEADETEIEVWAENAESFLVFANLGTQWRAGMGGAIGLDYTAIEPVLRLMRIEPDHWPDVFEDVLTMESAALKVMNSKDRHG